MNEVPEDIQALMSGYIDGEISPYERSRLERFLADSPDARKEFERMRELVTTASSLSVRQPPEEVWDTFLDNVYNRLERRTGWTILILGILALAVFGGYHFVVDPWASAIQKTLLAAPVAGFGIVFVSVLRQRVFAAKTDRYSREVKR